MKPWPPLAVAVVLEVSATLALRAALDQPWWYVVVAIGYAGAFLGLSVALRAGLGLGVAYGMWAAGGVTLTAILAPMLFGESMSATTWLGIGLVVGGVLCVEMGAEK